MSAVLVQVGNTISQKQQIGTSGNTGDTGLPRIPHLHFEVRVQNAATAWASTDPNGWTSASKNDPWKAHPQGVESVRLWVANPVVATPTNYASFIIDDNSPKFKKWCAADVTGVNCPFWWDSGLGYGGHMFYTMATGTKTPDYQARWKPGYSTNNQYYEVLVYIPKKYTTERVATARYIVYFNTGLARTVIVDQNFFDFDTWVSLGTYFFIPEFASVKVSDAGYFGGYIDPDTNAVIVDAVKFIRRSP